MPEGHTIHRIARDHQKAFAGQTLRVTSPQGRFRAGARRITRSTLRQVEAYGKHLFYRWDEHTLHIHLGLYGKFRRHQIPVPKPRGEVRLRVVGDEAAFDLNGPTKCELITPDAEAVLLNRLGPDPLRSDADPEKAWAKITKTKRGIGALLLDQSVIAGVGNVYRAEVLYLLRMHPDRPGNTLSRREFDQMWKRIVDLLKIGERYNRIIVADPKDVGKSRSRMNRSERLLIYKKAHCGRCAAPVRQWKSASRKIYACPVCQPAE